VQTFASLNCIPEEDSWIKKKEEEEEEEEGEKMHGVDRIGSKRSKRRFFNAECQGGS
jgi:hypothetical protein